MEFCWSAAVGTLSWNNTGASFGARQCWESRCSTGSRPKRSRQCFWWVEVFTENFLVVVRVPLHLGCFPQNPLVSGSELPRSLSSDLARGVAVLKDLFSCCLLWAHQTKGLKMSRVGEDC